MRLPERRVEAQRIVKAAAAVLLVLACASTAQQPRVFQTEAGPMRLVTVATGLDEPWSLAFLPDGRMLVTEKAGQLRIVGRDGRLSDPLPGVPDVASSGQGGLLDVALDPRFAENRLIYLAYSEPGGAGAGTAVARARLGEAALEGLTVIFRQQPKVNGAGHFGSRLVFARDGNLFVTLGERQKGAPAQKLDEHLGKVVRIAPDGSVPPDNPFVGRPGVLPEIWSYGHRNSQGATLHPVTGALWIIEHGAQGGDEVNIPRPGRNYGWPIISYGLDYSGARIGDGTAKQGMEQPVHYWDPSIAPSGLAFYTGDKVAAWKGSLFAGSLKFGLVSRLEVKDEKVVKEERLFQGLGGRVRDVRQGPDGYLYLVIQSPAGEILRVEPAGS
jgi:glucose/arabinose dehydrogenase